MVVIPWPSGAAWEQQLELGGRIYILRAQWNTRGEYWALSIFDRVDNPILQALKLVSSIDLLAAYAGDAISGKLLVVPVTRIERIGRNDMGDKVQLMYDPV